MFVKTFGSAVNGVDAFTIKIEVNVGGGSMGYVLVGLPDNAVREGRERVMTAIRNSGFKFPRGNVVINMAPADVKKEGSGYDLGIAIGVLAASRQVDLEALGSYLFLGELSLDGTLQSVKGVLPMVIQAHKDGFQGVILPEENAEEAAIVTKLDVIPATTLKEVVGFLEGEIEIEPVKRDTRGMFYEAMQDGVLDISDVKGQLIGKRGLEVAAAGGHNVLMIGPPGAGKTMLAKRIPGILPPLDLAEALETTKIHSVAGRLGSKTALLAHRPFRSPHHTISDVALVGGGSFPHPGEISLAHNGVLFLDELPEYKRTVLEVLRQPLEDRKITVSRARFTVEFPANFMLIGSMNPWGCVTFL